ncbi:MAG: beta-ketoacyl reductase, partial [Phototrophicaceae bacterium]
VKSNLKGVAFLWNLYQPEQITLDTLSENHNTALTAALHLARELPKLNIKEARLWFVSRGAQAVGISSVSEAGLAQAPLWGLARVVTLEHPETFGAVIDLDPENLTDEAAALVDDLLHADGEDQIAYRDGERYAVRLQPLAENEQPRQTVTLRADAAYLITGGFGKLGLKVAEYLVRHGAKHLVLTSRRGLPDRATWTQPTDDSTREAINGVLLLESLGATVYPAAADVTDVDGMGAVFAAFGNTLPALAGIVHAAGLLDSAYIADLTAEQMQRVLRPKVQGTWVLHQLSEHLPLDFFLQFSSASSTWGSAMAAHYVAANHFQDIFAHYRRKRGLTAQAINWGWWDGGGMVSTEEQTYFDGIGLKIMPQADGLSAMGHFLATHPVQVTVAPVDWSRYKPVFEAKRLRPFLQRIIVQASADDSSGADAALLAEIAEMPASERPLRLILLVQQTLAALLRIESPALIDPQGGFFDLGLDSLTSIELRSTLERTLGLDLPATVAFEYSTAETMATFLLNSLPDMGGSDAAPEPITYTPSVSLTSWTDATPQAAPDLDSMSDDELLALLEQELGAD